MNTRIKTVYRCSRCHGTSSSKTRCPHCGARGEQKQVMPAPFKRSTKSARRSR